MAKIKKRNPLNPSEHTKTRQSFIDYDYTSKLSKTDKDWLSKFTDEYYAGSFDENDRKNLIKGVSNHRKIWVEDSKRRICQFNLAQIGRLLCMDGILENIEDECALGLDEVLAIIENRIKFVSKEQVHTLLNEIKDFYQCTNN